MSECLYIKHPVKHDLSVSMVILYISLPPQRHLPLSISLSVTAREGNNPNCQQCVGPSGQTDEVK